MTIKPLNKYIHKKWYGSQCETRLSTYHTITPVLYRNALKESDKTGTFSHHAPQARNLFQRSAVDSELGMVCRVLPGQLIHGPCLTFKDTKINVKSILQVTGSYCVEADPRNNRLWSCFWSPVAERPWAVNIYLTFSSATGSESSKGEMRER